MTMRYVKKPIPIEALQWTGDNYMEICNLAGQVLSVDEGGFLIIPTMEGNLQAKPTDWIIKGVKGEIYPCDDEIFQMTYDPVESVSFTGGVRYELSTEEPAV